MKLILILSTLVPLLDSSQTCESCFNNICHTRRKIFEAEQLSGQMALDRMDNLLHVHYKDYKSTDHTVVIDLNFDEMNVHELPIGFSFARAINQATGEVYFSGNKGIYKYSTVTRQTEAFGQFRRVIWHMQFKGKLYFTEYQEPGLYYIENNRTRCIPELQDYVIDDFIIDKRDDIYFVREYLVYKLKKDDVAPTLFSPVLYSLQTDIYDNAYFMDTNERLLYRLDYSKNKLVMMGVFRQGTLVFRMAFDKQNRIIYSDSTDDKVYSLVAQNSYCNIRITPNNRTSD